MVKVVRKSYKNHKAQFPKLSCFYWLNTLISRHYFIPNDKDEIQIRV